MTLPSDKRNFTLALGGLAGMIWLIKAGNKSHTKTFFHLCIREIPYGSSTYDCEGSQYLVLLACHGQVSNGIMMAVATQFQNSMLGHQYTHQKGHPSGIFVTRINHSTNQAQISLHYECSRKPIPFSPSKRLH